MYNEISYKLLSKLRGDRTQLEMSKLMGYKTNQYYKFEAGLKKFKLRDLITICDIIELPLTDVLNEKLNLSIDNLSVFTIQSEFIKTWSTKEHLYLRQVLQTSDARFRRILRGAAELSVAEFLLVIDKISDRLASFLSAFSSLDIYSFSELPQVKRHGLVDLYLKYPEALVLGNAAKLNRINEKADNLKMKALLDYTEIDKTRFDEIYDYLINQEYLKIENEKYHLSGFNVNVQAEYSSEQLGQKIWEYLTDLSLMRSKITGKNLGTSTRVASVSLEAKEKINKVLEESYKKVNEIIDLDKNFEKSDIFYFRREAYYHEDFQQYKKASRG